LLKVVSKGGHVKWENSWLGEESSQFSPVLRHGFVDSEIVCIEEVLVCEGSFWNALLAIQYERLTIKGVVHKMELVKNLLYKENQQGISPIGPWIIIVAQKLHVSNGDAEEGEIRGMITSIVWGVESWPLWVHLIVPR
jgi:hypothetical protein